jgi:hypothetical protein
MSSCKQGCGLVGRVLAHHCAPPDASEVVKKLSSCDMSTRPVIRTSRCQMLVRRVGERREKKIEDD